MPLTLAIDLGTTNLKVGLVNEQGEILSLRSIPVTTISTEPGAAEHNAEQLAQQVLELCKQVVTDEFKGQVEYVISSTYQFGLMLLDKERKPLSGITLLSDTRSQQTFNEFLSEFSSENIYQETGCPLISQYVLPRLYYFKKQRPSLFERVKFFSDSKSFLFELLTGQCVTDMSTAAATQLYNAHTLQWD